MNDLSHLEGQEIRVISPETIAAFNRFQDTLDRFKADIVDCIDFSKLTNEMKQQRQKT
uniref:Uncharacterized protein n=1 Tax=viral metagenome TaxID=1070528 RepID=A0A6M3LT40_9ZZZZ